MAKKVKAGPKKVKRVYFKIRGEFVRLTVTEKEEKKGKDKRIRRYLKAVDPETGKTVSRQVSQEVFEKIEDPD